MPFNKYSILPFLLLPLLMVFQSSYAQVDKVVFGKNRVQYNDDMSAWSFYETENYITFWYGKGRNIGQAVSMIAEKNYEDVRSTVEHIINDKIKIIVYTDETDLRQSNIGLSEAFEYKVNETKVSGIKMFVYFNGDHANLEEQIKRGTAQILIDHMMLGNKIQEKVQNSVLLNLPSWYIKGLANYIGKGWNIEDDDALRKVMLNPKYKGFKKTILKKPILLGGAFWYYIVNNYSHNSIAHLLYMSRLNRDMESAFFYVLGSDYDNIVANFELYFLERYEKDKAIVNFEQLELIDFKNYRKAKILDAKLSPDGTQLAIVTNEIGKSKVFLYEMSTGKQKLIHKMGTRNNIQAPDYNYSKISWKPNGNELAIIYEKKDEIFIALYNIFSGETILEPVNSKYARIFGFDFIDNDNIVISALAKGYTDLFEYNLPTRQSKSITADFYDDLDPVFVNLENNRGIIFSSNRDNILLEAMPLDSILPKPDFDLFYFDLDNKSELIRLTNTIGINERHPEAIDTNYFSYLSDKSGIINKQKGYLKDVFSHNELVYILKDGFEIAIAEDSLHNKVDSTLVDSSFIRPIFEKKAVTHEVGNSPTHILSHCFSGTKEIEVLFFNNKYQLIVKDSLDHSKIIHPTVTTLYNQDKTIDKKKEDITTADDFFIEEKEEKKEDIEIITDDDFYFQSSFEEESWEEKEVESETSVRKLESEFKNVQKIPPVNSQTVQSPLQFNRSRIVPYRLKFRTKFPRIRFSNEILVKGIQNYADISQYGENTTPSGSLFKFKFEEVLEDYYIEAGVRLPVAFNGNEVFLSFENRKKKIDKRYAFYRSSFKKSLPEKTYIVHKKETINFVALSSFRYPFSMYMALEATATFRNIRLKSLITEASSLNTPVNNKQRFGVRLEYIFDNTLDIGINIKNGFRGKVFMDISKKFKIDYTDKFEFSFGKGFMYILGTDARYYQRLDNKSILAFRFASELSMGSDKILYQLGGTDNWLIPVYDELVNQPSEETYAYQTLALNLRGFKRNVRNGNNYAVFNTELRLPIIQYIFKRVRSPFWKNLQLVGFFDMGAAWVGKNPLAIDNPANTHIIKNPLSPVSIEVQYYRDPLASGYGFGLRTYMFRHFMRFDYAWGYENGIVLDPRLYFSIGYDF